MQANRPLPTKYKKIIRLRDQLQTENVTLKTEKEALNAKVQAFEKKGKR